jgi:2-methylisocitrate lyase-like PEP mutase family enzyme
LPDYGLLTMTEMVGNAARITAAAGSLPLIADGDTGYGTELNVVRTVQEHERAGAAGIHIDDQVSPKQCGHLEGKQLVSSEEFLAKIRAAVATRRDPDFVVIARTDARSVAGFDEAIRRANAALEAGADLAFVESPESLRRWRWCRGASPALPAERLLGRQDPAGRSARSADDGLQGRHPAGPVAENRLRRLRRRAEGDASTPDAAL